MIPLNLTAVTLATPFIQRKPKTPDFITTKTLQNFIYFSFIISTFKQTSDSISTKFSNTALRHFKRKTMAEMHAQITLDEDQEMETQPIYISSDESEIASPGSSPIIQLPNNVPDTYSAIIQLKAAQHEQVSSSSNFALQYPTTPPFSLISDDDNDEVFPPLTGNPAQL